MRRPLLAFLFSLLSLLASTASAAAATERGALFKVSLDGHEMHLFGTLHVGLPEFYPLEPRIAEALGQASTLALEIDPAQPQRELLRAVREHGMLDPGAAGYDGMDGEHRAQLDRLVAQGGLDAARVMTYKPMLLATLLTLAEYTKQSYRTDLSSEAWLVWQARAQGARVLELESLGGQLALLDRLAEPDRWRFLNDTLAAIASGAQGAEARAMAEAWSAADRSALDDIAARCEADASVAGSFVNKVLLKERNAGLADSLLNLLRKEPRTFAAVGVLHLLGSESVPKLLQEKGVKVERIY